MQPLKDLRVVELATVLAGPTVGTFLAELGAEVIKVEHPHHPDVTRGWKRPSESKESKVSAYFSAANARKSFVALDWKDENDLHKLQENLSTADILLTNFRDFSRCPDGLRPKDFLLRNPRLIYCQLDGYESTPGRPAYDVVLQAETGYTSMNGSPESGPLKLPLAFMDLNAAHQMKSAILLALYEREKTGKGCLIRCSLERSAVANLANQATNFLMADHLPKPSGSLHPNIAPYGETFTCADGRLLVLAVGSDSQFQALCTLLNHPEWAVDRRFAENAERVVHRHALAELLAQELKEQAAESWSRQMVSARIPAGVVRDMREVFETPFAQSMLVQEHIQGQDTVRPSQLGFRLLPLTSEP